MTSSTPFALRLESARNRFNDSDYTEAAKILTELIDEIEPSGQSPDATSEHDHAPHATTDLRLLLARAYFGSAQLGRAQEVLEKLAEEHPDDGYIQHLLGRTLQREGKHDAAKRHLALAEVLGDYEKPKAYGG